MPAGAVKFITLICDVRPTHCPRAAILPFHHHFQHLPDVAPIPCTPICFCLSFTTATAAPFLRRESHPPILTPEYSAAENT